MDLKLLCTCVDENTLHIDLSSKLGSPNDTRVMPQFFIIFLLFLPIFPTYSNIFHHFPINFSGVASSIHILHLLDFPHVSSICICVSSISSPK